MSSATPIQTPSNPCDAALGGYTEVKEGWMPASQVRAIVFNDPAAIWLKHFGQLHGFEADKSAYDFFDFVVGKSRQFEAAWCKHVVGENAVRVCNEAYEVRSHEKVRKTFELMQSAIPVITQPALWWAPEKIYGVPDLLVHTCWLRDKFPALIADANSKIGAPYLGSQSGHYVVFDIKFTTKLEETAKTQDLRNYAAQVRLYSFMLGQLQGLMPAHAYLVTRDRLSNPVSIAISSMLSRPLDTDLAELRDHYVDIVHNGTAYLPWKDSVVTYNLGHDDERWATTKQRIAKEFVRGGDPELIYQIGPGVKAHLATLGFGSIDALLSADPATVPLEQCKGCGPAKSKQIRAVLRANRAGVPVPPNPTLVPPKREFEFFVDYEFFTNINVDFDRQWPSLEGCEMVFMIGVGWEDKTGWRFLSFVAEDESRQSEKRLFDDAIEFLTTATAGHLSDTDRAASYHWSSAEIWQSTRAADRHAFPADHHLRHLPWCDLQKVFLGTPCCLPGAFGFGIKEVAQALAAVKPTLATDWPGDLDSGLRAMVMGWKAFSSATPRESAEMALLNQYLEADCKALRNILGWLRS